ncbi:MAG: asparagine synthase (glutamine-hydrolyzing), partial [Bacteroidota bacterium]
MCGIIAQMNFLEPVNQAIFDVARDTMFHRGPDGAGSEFFEDGRIGLGHRRLSIIDLSEAGRQPLSNEDETIWLSFNGEIYNYPDLRNILEGKGHRFSTNTDSEVLVHGYEEWGTEIVNHLKGMFAFVIWDSLKKEMFVARDHFGIKPVCFYQDKNTFVVASELKAIVALPDVPADIDFRSVADFFTLRYIPSPQSIWKGIKKLQPGHCMMVHADGHVKVWPYWQPHFQQNRINEKTATEQLDDLLQTAVREQLQSDVSVGLLLSGGMDSSVIADYAT